jgi:O-antigen ligase
MASRTTQSSMHNQMPRYIAIFNGGLLLFSLSLALSKSAANILIALLLLYVVTLAIYRREFRTAIVRNASQPLLLPLALFLSVAVIGLLFTENIRDGVGIVNKFFGLFLVYIMVSVLLDWLETKKGESGFAERSLLAFLVGIFALDLIAVPSYLGIAGDTQIARSITPLLNLHHIWFANLNAVGMYAAAGILLFPPRPAGIRKKTFLASFVVLDGASVLLSASRSAWLGMLITVIVLAHLCVKKKKTYFILLAAVIGGAVLLYLFNGIVHMRVNRVARDISLFLAGQASTDVGERFLMWKAAFRMFLSNPLFGVGTGDYVSTMNRFMASGEFPAYLAQFNQPHNMYLFALATNGLVGLSALLYIFYRGLRFALPLLKSGGSEKFFAFLATATIVHYMVAGMTDSFFNIQILRYVFGFLMGVCVRNSVKAETVKG